MADIIPGLSKKYGVPEWVVRQMLGKESGNRQTNPDGSVVTSPKGAQGAAQLMPGTARALERRYGIDTSTYAGNVEGGVAYLSEQLKRFGSIPLALSAYNSGPAGSESRGLVESYAETQKYVKDIMAGQKSGGGSGGALPAGTAPASPAPSGGFDKRAAGLALLRAFQLKGDQRTSAMNSVLQAARGGQYTKAAPVQLSQGANGGYGAVGAPQGNGAWGGSQDVARGFAELGFSHGLRATSEKRDRQSTASGGVSDHWTGKKNAYAFDLSNGTSTTPQMDAAAKQIAARLGVSWQGGPLEISRVVNGYRIQVMYRTQTGGNHNDHIHVGVERVG